MEIFSKHSKIPNIYPASLFAPSALKNLTLKNHICKNWLKLLKKSKKSKKRGQLNKWKKRKESKKRKKRKARNNRTTKVFQRSFKYSSHILEN